MSFLVYLTREIRSKLNVSPNELSTDNLLGMMKQAAASAVADAGGLETVRLTREVSPDDLTVFACLTVGPDEYLLSDREISTLRALLLSYDEFAGPQVGDRLTIPRQLSDGSVVSEVTADMLEDRT